MAWFYDVRDAAFPILASHFSFIRCWSNAAAISGRLLSPNAPREPSKAGQKPSNAAVNRIIAPIFEFLFLMNSIFGHRKYLRRASLLATPALPLKYYMHSKSANTTNKESFSRKRQALLMQPAKAKLCIVGRQEKERFREDCVFAVR